LRRNGNEVREAAAGESGVAPTRGSAPKGANIVGSTHKDSEFCSKRHSDGHVDLNRLAHPELPTCSPIGCTASFTVISSPAWKRDGPGEQIEWPPETRRLTFRWMSGGGERVDWFHKYKFMKKKYHELLNVRVKSVQGDIQTISSRIQEHVEAHQAMTSDTRQHTSDLQRMINATARMKEEVQSMQTNVHRLQRDLKYRDSVLRVLIEYPEFQVRMVKEGSYKVTCGPPGLRELSFGLVHDAEVQYIPVSIPDYRNIPKYMFAEFSFQLAKLNEFCRAVIDVLPRLR
jgi:hypothetical protein